MDRGIWRATVHKVAESQTRWSDLACRDKEGTGEEREAGLGLTLPGRFCRLWGTGALASCLVVKAGLKCAKREI